MIRRYAEYLPTFMNKVLLTNDLSQCHCNMVLVTSDIVQMIFSLLTCVLSTRKYVCRTFEDYYLFPPLNRNCYYNPDIDLSVVSVFQKILFVYSLLISCLARNNREAWISSWNTLYNYQGWVYFNSVSYTTWEK